MLKRHELTNPDSCMSRAKEDEMVFVLLGHDIAAPAAIKAWVAERIRLGKNSPLDEQIREAEACADKMMQKMNRKFWDSLTALAHPKPKGAVLWEHTGEEDCPCATCRADRAYLAG